MIEPGKAQERMKLLLLNCHVLVSKYITRGWLGDEEVAKKY